MLHRLPKTRRSTKRVLTPDTPPAVGKLVAAPSSRTAHSRHRTIVTELAWVGVSVQASPSRSHRRCCSF